LVSLYSTIQLNINSEEIDKSNYIKNIYICPEVQAYLQKKPMLQYDKLAHRSIKGATG